VVFADAFGHYVDYPVANSLGIDVKYYYVGLYVYSNLVILLMALANIDRRLHQSGEKPSS
jgi:hypothetical protein